MFGRSPVVVDRPYGVRTLEATEATGCMLALGGDDVVCVCVCV